MQRRQFSLAAATAASSLLLSANNAFAQPAAPVQGKQYLALAKPISTDAPAGKVEVLEFFWYSCGHCNAFEPMFSAWKKNAPASVIVHQVPVAFNSSFVPQQKLFYTLQDMDLLPSLHAKVFHAIHVERNRLANDDAIFEWIGKQGVDVSKFKQVYNSFSVASKARKATQLMQDYGVEGVPSMGVAGRYYTDGTYAGSSANMLVVVDYLIQQSLKAA